MPLKEIAYVPELEKLLQAQGEQAESWSILHNLAYEKYQFRSNIINIPVIVLSSVIGLLTGMNIQNDDMFIILSTGSIFVSVIKSIDSYFQLQKRAEGHRICALQFSQMFKKIQIELSLQRDMRSNPKDMLTLIKTDLKNLFDIAPLIDEDIIDKYNRLYKAETDVSKPSVCNGLTHIHISAEVDEAPQYGKGTKVPFDPPLHRGGLRGDECPPSRMYYDPDIDNPALNPPDAENGVIMSVKPLGSQTWIDTKIDPSGNVVEEERAPDIEIINVEGGELM